MRATVVASLVVLLFNKSFLKEACAEEINCRDVKYVGRIFNALSSKEKDDVQIKFYLSTNKQKDEVEIGHTDWSGLRTSGFDPSKKSFIIIHGYHSGGTRPWVVDIKDKLLKTVQANVISVDWSQASNRKNYVNAARNTIRASNQILSTLQAMRAQVEGMNKTPEGIKWNHLHFIGHSLGAQVSGQTAHLLKRDKFWKVERITGLDPAKPCFTKVDPSLRIDKEDADFVDIIHTQAGNGGTIDSLGLHENVGHVDFYVNGAVVQPQCLGSFFTPMWDTMICSHKLAAKYFSDSIMSSVNGYCSFPSYEWDGTYANAQRMLSRKIKGSVCLECPEMGFNAVKGRGIGKFIVFTASNEPYCDFKDQNLKNLIKVIRRLKKSSSENGSSNLEVLPLDTIH